MRRWTEPLAQDLGYAIRSFRRSPGFVLVALLSLTLGIGATSAIFSVIYGVLIAPYPYARPGEIWAPEIRALDDRGGRGYTVDELRLLAEASRLLVGDGDIDGVGPADRRVCARELQRRAADGNAFNFLGVPPVIGRTIQPSDVRPDGDVEPVVVLSHRLWLRLFEGSPSALGRTMELNGRQHTIVGVMPPRFGWYGNEGFWLPLSPTRKDIPWANPILRLAPGVSPGCRRRAAESAEPAPCSREAVDVSAAGLHDEAEELPRHHRRQRRDAHQPQAAAWRGRFPAAHRVRERRQPAARPRHCPRPRDGRTHVDRRRPSPTAAAAAHRKRGAVARRRSVRRAVCVRRDPRHRRADAGVLRAERIARHDQRSGPLLLACGLAPDRHCLRPGAGAAGVEARRDRCPSAPAEARARRPKADGRAICSS